MRKYTANYSNTNSNFVIQNLEGNTIDHKIVPLLKVLKNILQRGAPTILSKFLQTRLGQLDQLASFKDRFALVSPNPQRWLATIKGDDVNRYYPAREFLEEIIPREFGEWAFVQAMIVPEMAIEDIVCGTKTAFTNQQVDFYLPQARLVIEIDGQQHKSDRLVKNNDRERDRFLASQGIHTVRITTSELGNGDYRKKIEEVLKRLESFEKPLGVYRECLKATQSGSTKGDIWSQKMLPTAIIRFQILVLELLLNGTLPLDATWRFELRRHEDFEGFAILAIEDLQIWITKLWRLRFKTTVKRPDFEIVEIGPSDSFGRAKGAIKIDFSILQRYTDAHTKEPDVIYVRTDYFDESDRNYFKVSCASPINYAITKEDEDILTFFLTNIFDKESFRDGQFPIISNALNLRDTIGLLPTGGGKSLCYQLPCFLQPSVNFVVCPIKSLMKDQADNLANLWITNVAHISSDISSEERRKAETNFGGGRYLFVWISPERLQIQDFRDKIKDLQANGSIAYAVIDEVHCLSEWGHSFRTSYLNLAKTIDRLSPPDEKGEGRTKFIGLTATASVNVLKDIKVEFSRQKGQLDDANVKSLLDYSRKELVFQVIEDKGLKEKKMKDLLKSLSSTTGLTTDTEKAALIFTPHVNGPFGCYELSKVLNLWFPGKCDWYAGDVPKQKQFDANRRPTKHKVPIMSDIELKQHKDRVQQDFKENKFPLMVATKAFGMGIDKSNIHFTFHFGLPSSVEALYQEAGRAGRWDTKRAENAGKNATCYILYSRETVDLKVVQSIFQMQTSFSEMERINDEFKKTGKDVFRQLFLFTNGQNDIEAELETTLKVFKRYFKGGEDVTIFFSESRQNLKIDSTTLQKAIYRLSLAGVVTDWSTDFINHYQVSFADPNSDSIVQSVASYIRRYEPSRDVEMEIRNGKEGRMLKHALRFLLKWVFENITYNRKQSLKTLVDFCDDFQDSESFKRRLDNYFKFTEWTFILQHISESSRDYEKWFEVLTIIERDNQNEVKSRIYLPAIENQAERRRRFESLRDSISRFLESYRTNAGLNFLSGLVRLFLNDYQDSDGIGRFEDSIRQISVDFESSAQDAIISGAISIGKNLDVDRQTDLCCSIALHFPERLESIAIELDLLHLLADIIDGKVRSLKALNQNLYEQIGKI
jgi:ATP-dependent DNA helicase RecQ